MSPFNIGGILTVPGTLSEGDARRLSALFREFGDGNPFMAPAVDLGTDNVLTVEPDKRCAYCGNDQQGQDRCDGCGARKWELS